MNINKKTKSITILKSYLSRVFSLASRSVKKNEFIHWFWKEKSCGEVSFMYWTTIMNTSKMNITIKEWEFHQFIINHELSPQKKIKLKKRRMLYSSYSSNQYAVISFDYLIIKFNFGFFAINVFVLDVQYITQKIAFVLVWKFTSTLK